MNHPLTVILTGVLIDFSSLEYKSTHGLTGAPDTLKKMFLYLIGQTKAKWIGNYLCCLLRSTD